MIRLLIRARYVSFAVVALGLAGLLALGRGVTYEQSIQSFFAEDDPGVVGYQEASKSFGNDQFVFVAYDDPQALTPAGIARMAELAEALSPAHVEGVVRVESLDAMPVLWKLDDTLLQLQRLPGFLRTRAIEAAKAVLRGGGSGAGVGPNLGEAIRTADPEALTALRARITAHPLLRGTLIDAKGTATALVVRLKSPQDHDVKATIAALRERADAFGAKYHLGDPAIVGPPVLLADGFAAIERDGRRLAIVGMLLIGLVTLTATRSLWWAVVPILAGWTVWLATEAILATLHIKLSLSGGPMVAQIIVLTMPAASHLAIHYRDDRRRTADARTAAHETLRAVAVPILWCAITGAIGYGALLTSNVVPIHQFGAILAVCTLVAAVLTMAISPVAMLPPFPLEIPVRHGSTSRVSASLGGLTARVCRHPAPIVLGIVAVVVPLAAGMSRLEYESNYINAFTPESRVVRDYRFVEGRLGGIGLIALVVPSPKIDPATLDDFAALDRRIAEIRDADGPATAQVLSLATVLDPDGKLAALPPAERAGALATKLDLIAASPQADLLSGFWNPKTGLARVMVRVSEQQPAPAKEAVFSAALADAREVFGPEAYLTGLSYLLTRTTRGVMATQWSTCLWSIGGILLMLALAFRNVGLALLAILPTMLAVGLVLGLMGWLGVKLDIATALVASVALGLSVDDTFHCLLQFRRLREHHPFRESLLASYAVTGPGVLLSSIAVAVGFAVLRFSEFVPFVLFGTMVCIATAGSSLGNLILLPACLSLGRARADRLDLKGSGSPAPAGSSSTR